MASAFMTRISSPWPRKVAASSNSSRCWSSISGMPNSMLGDQELTRPSMGGTCLFFKSRDYDQPSANLFPHKSKDRVFCSLSLSPPASGGPRLPGVGLAGGFRPPAAFLQQIGNRLVGDAGFGGQADFAGA